jgi:poly-gamma-glutamate capsule biosynthesis protein CapA/YwtB (metallophosphatase superfamily)
MKRFLYRAFIFVIVLLFFHHPKILAEEKEKGELFSILCVGDIFPVNEAEQYILSRGISYPFKKIKNEFLKYDFIFGNLETPVTGRGTPYADKAYSFRIKPELAACLRDLKIDAVSIANNHLMDYNVEGMRDTISYLDFLNISHAGGGENLKEARRPAVLRFGGSEIYVLAYCNRPPVEYYATDRSPGIAPINIEIIKDDIATYKTKNNIVLVSLHWGIEQTSNPQSDQIRTAHQIIDSGADAIIGHHPHWPQGIEIYNGKPIIYSLGNFINGYYNHIEMDNIAVALYFRGSMLKRLNILPIAGQNRTIQFQPYVLRGDSADRLLQMIQNLSKKLNTDMQISGGVGFIPLIQNNISIGERSGGFTNNLMMIDKK